MKNIHCEPHNHASQFRWLNAPFNIQRGSTIVITLMAYAVWTIDHVLVHACCMHADRLHCGTCMHCLLKQASPRRASSSVQHKRAATPPQHSLFDNNLGLAMVFLHLMPLYSTSRFFYTIPQGSDVKII